MKWYDAYGERIDAGDIVMDTDARRIGRVVFKYNRPYMDVWKKFSVQRLAYEPVERFAVDDAYIRPLSPKKDWHYELFGGRLKHVEILRRAPSQSEPKRIVPKSMPEWEAPAPWM